MDKFTDIDPSTYDVVKVRSDDVLLDLVSAEVSWPSQDELSVLLAAWCSECRAGSDRVELIDDKMASRQMLWSRLTQVVWWMLMFLVVLVMAVLAFGG